jgi:hypothetical protein
LTSLKVENVVKPDKLFFCDGIGQISSNMLAQDTSNLDVVMHKTVGFILRSWKSIFVVSFAIGVTVTLWLFIAPPNPRSTSLDLYQVFIAYYMRLSLIWLVIYFLSWVVRRILRKSFAKKTLAIWCLVPTVLISSLEIYGHWIYNRAFSVWQAQQDARPFSPPRTTGPKFNPILVTDTVQDSEGMSESNLDLVFLENLEKHLSSRFQSKYQANLKNRNIEAKDAPTPQFSSTYVDIPYRSGEKRLGIVRIYIKNLQQVSIVGFVGATFHRVSCIRKSDEFIPIWSGKCGAKLRDVFGVSLQH